MEDFAVQGQTFAANELIENATADSRLAFLLSASSGLPMFLRYSSLRLFHQTVITTLHLRILNSNSALES